MALSEYLQRLGGQLAAKGNQREMGTPMDVAMRGQKIEGIAGEFNVSSNGLYAAAHRWGAGMVRQYLDFEKAHSWKSDANKFPADRAEAFKAIDPVARVPKHRRVGT
jgi:hypothetical protein